MKLALGTVQFGLDYGIANIKGQVSRVEAESILEHASMYGIDTLDTAIGYGNSERRLGEIGISRWQVVTKLPPVPEGCCDISRWVKVSAEESLQRLKVERLYGILLHCPQQLLDDEGDCLYRALHQLKQDGYAQKIGVSVYDPEELDSLCQRYQFDMVQAPFNIFDCRMIDSGWLARLSAMGVELHIRSVFLQGLLLMDETARPGKFRKWEKIWTLWDNWLTESGLTPLQACLRYVSMFPQIEKVVVGVDSTMQLSEIVSAVSGVIPSVPDGLNSRDLDLINPARWNVLS